MNYIELSDSHQAMIKEMFEFYYSKEIKIPLDFDSNNSLIYDINKSIHWYELIFNILQRKVLSNNFYWTNVFITKYIQYYTVELEHPVNYLYSFFLKAINNEPFFKKTENDFVLEVEEKENKKNQRVLDKKNKPPKVKKTEIEKPEEEKIKTKVVNKDTFF